MLSLFALRSLSTPSSLFLCAFYLCRRSLKCAPELWPLSKSTCKGPKRQRARRPKSSSSLPLSSTWCRRINPSTSPDRPVEAGESVAIVWWQRLCAGYSKCGGGGGCVSSRAVHWISSLCWHSPHYPPGRRLLIQLHLHKFRLHQSVCIMLSHDLKTLGIISLFNAQKNKGSSRVLGRSCVHLKIIPIAI